MTFRFSRFLCDVEVGKVYNIAGSYFYDMAMEVFSVHLLSSK